MPEFSRSLRRFRYHRRGAAHAALIIHSFVGELVFGPELGATGAGTFSYDDSGVTGVGEEFIHPADGLRIEFTSLGRVFSIVTVPMPGTLSLTLVGVAALIAARRLAARRV